MRIGYVCTNYNNADFTIKAVESLLAISGHDISVIVVDNSPVSLRDPNLVNLQLRHVMVKVIQSPTNVGYFAGLNLGIRALRGENPDIDYIVVGNNDLEFGFDFVAQIIAASKAFERFPVVSPDIVTMSGVHQNPHVIGPITRGRELVYDIYYSSFYAAVVIRFISKLLRPFSDRSDSEHWRSAGEIYQGHGSCYILGPKFFENFSELSAPTFLMGEEYFLSHQLASKGFSVYYDPSIKVTHSYHASIGGVPKRKMWEYARIAHAHYRKTVKLFDWSHRENPAAAFSVQRRRSSKKAFQRCTNCVMDTTDVKIRFDANGVCDHCNTFRLHTLPSWPQGREAADELERMISDIKRSGEGKEFDCILGMSGGIDSSYLTYLAKEKFGLKPLVFHVDAGWNSQEAVNNIERMVDGLKLELFTEVIDWNEMRDLQLSYFKSGVPHVDHPQDLAYFGTMYKFAHKHGIKYILTGANLSTECIRNPVDWGYYGDITQLRDIHRRYGRAPLKTFPLSHIIWHKIYLPYVLGQKTVRPLNLVPFVKQDAKKLLMERFGWQPYPQKHFESRFTRFIEGYWLPTRFGYDVRKVQFSSLIVTGQMTRQEAMDRLTETAYDPENVKQDFEYVAKKLGIEPAELESYRVMPLRTYRDYDSQDYLYRLGAKAMKLFGLEVGGKR
jgi:N-acetyl sugar amidotransferase